MLFSQKRRQVLAKIFAFSGMAAAAYHIAGICYKIDEAPAWRHFVFLAISLFCIYGILVRPKYFTYFFALLMLQQYYSHGSYLIHLWEEKRQVHRISVLVLALLPVVFICLVEDDREKKMFDHPL